MGKKSPQTRSDQFARRPFMQQQTMSVQALSRLLEAVAKLIRHATAMSMILATEILQARHDVILATSKVLLENPTTSCGILR